jgi:hypothetical protein
MTMRYRLLGPSGLRISEAFLGAMTFGEQGGIGEPIDECPRMLDSRPTATAGPLRHSVALDRLLVRLGSPESSATALVES